MEWESTKKSSLKYIIGILVALMFIERLLMKSRSLNNLTNFLRKETQTNIQSQKNDLTVGWCSAGQREPEHRILSKWCSLFIIFTNRQANQNQHKSIIIKHQNLTYFVIFITVVSRTTRASSTMALPVCQLHKMRKCTQLPEFKPNWTHCWRLCSWTNFHFCLFFSKWNFGKLCYTDFTHDRSNATACDTSSPASPWSDFSGKMELPHCAFLDPGRCVSTFHASLNSIPFGNYDNQLSNYHGESIWLIKVSWLHIVCGTPHPSLDKWLQLAAAWQASTVRTDGTSYIKPKFTFVWIIYHGLTGKYMLYRPL